MAGFNSQNFSTCFNKTKTKNDFQKWDMEKRNSVKRRWQSLVQEPTEDLSRNGLLRCWYSMQNQRRPCWKGGVSVVWLPSWLFWCVGLWVPLCVKCIWGDWGRDFFLSFADVQWVFVLEIVLVPFESLCMRKIMCHSDWKRTPTSLKWALCFTYLVCSSRSNLEAFVSCFNLSKCVVLGGGINLSNITVYERNTNGAPTAKLMKSILTWLYKPEATMQFESSCVCYLGNQIHRKLWWVGKFQVML